MKYTMVIVLFAQITLLYGQVATTLHDASSSARGGGFVTDYSAGSVFDNPAGLSSISGTHLLGNFTWFETFPGVHGSALGFTTAINQWNLGIDVQAVGDKIFRSQHVGFSLSHSIHLTSIGAKLKWTMLGLEGLGTIHRAGIDIGAISKIGKNIRVGVFASNINSPLLDSTYKEYMALRMTFGIYYQLAENAALSVDLHKIVDQTHWFSMGLEYQVLKWVEFMLGVSGHPMAVHFGLRISKGKKRIAYGMGHQNGFGNNHTWTLDYGF